MANRSQAVRFRLQEISATDRLEFAKWVLFGSAVLLLLAGVSYVWNQDAGQKIFDEISRMVPPIVTLVIGYYFSKHP
jgi:hypothetical protein